MGCRSNEYIREVIVKEEIVGDSFEIINREFLLPIQRVLKKIASQQSSDE